MGMLTLFLRAIFLDLFVLLIIRLVGKRQVSDLEPYDLLLTLIIADLASCAIADPDIPLLYSIVPILALFLTQRTLSKLSLKSAGFRRILCGTPQVLIMDGILQEKVMRQVNYTVRDLLDSLRNKEIFDIGQVAYAILESNGSVSVLQKGEYQNPTLKDLNLKPDAAVLSHLLILQGKTQKNALEALHIEQADVDRILKKVKIDPKNIFYAQLSAHGELRIQINHTSGGRVLVFDDVA